MTDKTFMVLGTILIDYYKKKSQQSDKTVTRQAEKIARQKERIGQLEAENEQLRELLEGKAESKAAKKPKFTENYSLDKHQRKKKPRQKSTGRRSGAAKRDMIKENYEIYWENANPDDCVLHREQFAWRIMDGKAIYIGYTIYDVPNSKKLPLPSGLRNSRSEYGIEIILILAFLHYFIGVSIDKARAIMQFFLGLDLSKSQADSLLSQLAADWDEQYDTITELIALSLIVYIDETGWKVGKRSCYTWVFSTALHVLFSCGVGRSKTEAEKVLGPLFAGIGVTDDYSAYKKLFTQHQLCWAHLLRKAIKLALQHPDEKQYATFLDELFSIYQEAVRYQKDGRLSIGRAQKVLDLQEKIRSLCTRHGETIDENAIPDHEATFIRLQNELVDNVDCLFVFVEHPQVEPTNNRSERNVRCEAEIRKGGRTSKSDAGAKRRSIIMTVLMSLRTRFTKFTLDTLLREVEQWIEQGCSIFEKELAELKMANAP
ncbi:MAG: transposase [Planctomycetes bacterium]|nr:transposase [Planctomycetota bacterium]